jgi:hypothetical protein
MGKTILPNDGVLYPLLDRVSLVDRKQMELRARLEVTDERDLTAENARYRFRLVSTTKVHGGVLYRAEFSADEGSSFSRIMEQNVFTLEGAVAACDSYRQNLLSRVTTYLLKDPS